MKLQVTVRHVHDELHVHTFRDWDDFAAWLRQELVQHEVTIVSWKYIRS